MPRPQQQALLFLLGAVLVGGVLGFSADRALRHARHTISERRRALYADLALAPAQRASMDSILDERSCEYDAAVRSVQPVVDSVRARARIRINAILTPEQRTKVEAKRREEDTRQQQELQRLRERCR